jgi:hypothetical protein
MPQAPDWWLARKDRDEVLARIRHLASLPNWRPAWEIPSILQVRPDGVVEVETAEEAVAISRNVTTTRGRLRGSMSKRTQSALPHVLALHHRGKSIREIARATGLSKPTIQKLVPKRSRSEALVLKHKQWKAEGRPVIPPWQRKRAA